MTIHFSCVSSCVLVSFMYDDPWCDFPTIFMHIRNLHRTIRMGILKAPSRISTTRSCRLVKAQHLECDIMNVRRLVVGEWGVLQMSFAGDVVLKTNLPNNYGDTTCHIYAFSSFLQHITYCCKWKKSCTSFFLVNISH